MKITNEVKVGILAMVALAILAIGYNYLKGKNIFSQSTILYAEYDRIDGLLVGNPVQQSGFGIGMVEDIKLNPDNSGKILVTLNLDNDKIINIPKGTEATIVSLGIMGEMAVRLDLPKDKNGIILQGSNAASGETLKGTVELGMTDAVTSQIVPVKEQVEVLLANMNVLMKDLRTSLDKERMESLVANLDESLKSVSKITKDLESTTGSLNKELNSKMAKIDVVLDDVTSFANNLKNNNQSINTIMKNAEEVSKGLAKADIAQSMQNLQGTIDNADKTMGELNTVMNKVNSGQGSLGALVNDDKLYDNLSNASANANLLLEDFKENPKRYVGFSVFGRKDKNKDKD